ncbi:hypothetical protein SUGI_0092380 [Cryptomeria japonica]|nr:hypothetical protein SUGI_0092380 [Cryptomeria japonica]
MAFNNSYSSEKRYLANPKDLRFTQPDIKSTFTDPTHPTVRETASLIRRDFVPRIRGEASRVQIPPPPTSGRNAYQMQKGLSAPGSVSAGHLVFPPSTTSYEDELEARFTKLAIKSTFNGPIYPTHRDSVSLTQRGEVNPDDLVSVPSIKAGGSVVQITKRNDAVFMPSVTAGGSGVRITKRNDAVFMPRNDVVFMPSVRAGSPIPPTPISGRNACQMEKETSLLDSVSAGYSRGQLYKSHQYHEVHYNYLYEEDGAPEDEYPYVHKVLCEAQDEVEYCHFPYPEDYDSDVYW